MEQFDTNELTDDLYTFDPKRPGLSRWWLWAEEVTTAEEKEEVGKYYTNETRTWRSLRRILNRRYREVAAKAPDFSSPNLAAEIGKQEGYKEALRDMWRLIPRPKGDK